jgi:hypothetical protein
MGAHAAVAQAVCAVSILALQVWPDQQHPEFQAALYGGGGRAHQLGHSLSCQLPAVPAVPPRAPGCGLHTAAPGPLVSPGCHLPAVLAVAPQQRVHPY